MDVGSVNTIIQTASQLDQMSLQSQVNTSVLKKTLDINKSQASDMIAMIDQQKNALATSGSVGTRVNTFA